MEQQRSKLKEAFSLYIQNSIVFLKSFVFFIVLFNIIRTCILIAYKPAEGLSGFYSDVFWSYMHGFRFDAVVILYALILFPAINTIALLFSIYKTSFLKKIPQIGKVYLYIISPLILIFLVVDFYFFSYYHTHINLLVFGFWEDETKSILTTIVEDFPIFKLIFGLALFIYILHRYIIPKIFKISSPEKIYTPTFFIIFFLLLNTAYLFGMRGTWSGRVLCLQENGVVSHHSFINDLMPNGFFTLREAIEQRVKNELITDPKVAMSNYGITDENRLFHEYQQLMQSDSDYYFLHTPKNDLIKNNPPHILFLQMESMGGDLLTYQSDKFDILGELKDATKDAYIFNEFTCGNIMTVHSLEGLTINALITPVSYTADYSHTYTASNILPYIKQGYETQYVTGGRLSWHNLEKFLPAQGFQLLDGSSIIAQKVKGAVEMEWGVADEYFFDYIYQSLKESKKPRLIYGMSISNHTPFDIPESYQAKKLVIPDSMYSRLGCKKEIAEKNIRSYQYANDMLGKFLKKLHHDKLDTNLIIVITGDHFCHDLFNYSDLDIYKKYLVACIYILPDKYKPAKKPGLNIHASHKDIFPTLFHLSLPGAAYYNNGVNMFAPDNSSRRFSFTKTEPGSVNYFVTNKLGAVKKNLNNYNFYRWKNQWELMETTEKDTSILLLKRQADIYNAAMDYYQLSDKNKKKPL